VVERDQLSEQVMQQKRENIDTIDKIHKMESGMFLLFIYVFIYVNKLNICKYIYINICIIYLLEIMRLQRENDVGAKKMKERDFEMEKLKNSNVG
jgi:hypothetical protein